MQTTKTKEEDLMDVALKALSFIADLNGYQWIKGNSRGEVDMRQRAKALQHSLYNVTRSEKESSFKNR